MTPFSLVDKWLTIPDKWCSNNVYGGKFNNDSTDELACQNLCEADSGCFGFVSNIKDMPQNYKCFLCQDDELSDSTSNFEFHRKPLGNNDVQSIV